MTEAAGSPRRAVLAVGGAGVLGLGLFAVAGCSASKGGASGCGGSSASAGSTLVKLSEVPVGGSVAGGCGGGVFGNLYALGVHYQCRRPAVSLSMPRVGL
jgi:hypothetical protein